MKDLDLILLSGSEKMIGEFDPKPELLAFRGANVTQFYEKTGVFIADDSSHCPRTSAFRALGIQERPSIKSLVSWATGRALEEVVKQMLTKSDVNLTWTEEEQAQAIFPPVVEGGLGLTARPDLFITNHATGKIYPVEMKSVQSFNTASTTFHLNKPKLGAVLQCLTQMIFHKTKIGSVLYGLPVWFSNYDFKTKQKLAFEPGINVMELELVGDDLYCDGVKTLITESGFHKGMELMDESWVAQEMMPVRPTWVDIFGVPTWDGCKYCPFATICGEMDGCENYSYEFATSRANMYPEKLRGYGMGT
jgi:hypothetical protein